MAKHDIIDEIATGCLMSCARRLSRVVTSIYEQELRPFGIKASQLNLLIAIAKAGPVRRIDLGRIADIDPSTLTRNLAIMLGNGWIEELIEGDDGRGNPVRLTANGHSLIDRVAPAWRKAQARARKTLGNDRADMLQTLFGPLQSGEP